MASLGRAMRRLASRPRLDVFFTEADSILPIPTEAPQVNLPHVDTQLDMHQFNGYFEDGSTAADGLRGWSDSMPAVLPQLTFWPCTDSHGSSGQPALPATSPDSNPGEAPTEWSAVGHAATGKSGRVIHSLQEDIARLTREMSVWRSRAEETQRSNETLKTQLQNTTGRLHNLEQVNETNLYSIARKDRKIEELRNELNAERTKRQDAEVNATKTNQTMREERENHNREQARSQEIAKYHESQYEVLASTSKRDKADLDKKINAIFAQVRVMADSQVKQTVSFDRLDVISDQKNREIEGLKDIHEKLMAAHAKYKQTKDDELRGAIERSHANDDSIDAALVSIKEVETEMKWVMRLSKSREEEEKKDPGKG